MLGGVEQLPRQGSSVVETLQKINFWAASHEEKWTNVPQKSEERVQVHREGKIKSLHIPRLMDGGDGKISIKVCVVKCIEHQWCKK